MILNARELALEFAPFSDLDVEATFSALPERMLTPLMRLRQLIIDTAAGTPEVGELVETLKWREPAYLPKRPHTGTTIRINVLRHSLDRYALYVPCQTTLVEAFRRYYANVLLFEGNRAVLLSVDADFPDAPLRHCIALALTYHRKARDEPPRSIR